MSYIQEATLDIRRSNRYANYGGKQSLIVVQTHISRNCPFRRKKIHNKEKKTLREFWPLATIFSVPYQKRLWNAMECCMHGFSGNQFQLLTVNEAIDDHEVIALVDTGKKAFAKNYNDERRHCGLRLFWCSHSIAWTPLGAVVSGEWYSPRF